MGPSMAKRIGYAQNPKGSFAKGGKRGLRQVD